MPGMTRIAGPMTVYSATATSVEVEFPLSPRYVGDAAAAIQFMIRVLTQSSANMMLGLRLDHGPDGTVAITHSTPITLVASASAPVLLVGDTRAASTRLAPWLHPVILTDLAAGTTQRFATIEVYELVTPT